MALDMARRSADAMRMASGESARLRHAWLPFGDASRRRRLCKVGGWIGATALAVVVLELLGVDVREWFSSLWDALTEIPLGYLVAGWSLQTVQTTLTAAGWYFILRAGFPVAPPAYGGVLGAYATGVALNGFLPANLGTFVMLLMFVAIIPGASFAGVVGGMVVQKVFFSVAGAFVYVYLFVSVEGSFQLQLRVLHDHPVLFGFLFAGAALLILILVRIFWRKLKGLWEKAKAGGAILARPPARLRGSRGAAVLRRVARQARRDCSVPRRLWHPGDLSLGDVRGRRQLDRQHCVRHARGRGRQSGDQRGCAQRSHRRRDRGRVFARPAARDNGVEHRLRSGRSALGVRLGRRQGLGRAIVRGRKGEGGGSQGEPRPLTRPSGGRQSMA